MRFYRSRCYHRFAPEWQQKKNISLQTECFADFLFHVNNHLCKIRMKINGNLSSDSHFHCGKTFVCRSQPFSAPTANISNCRSYLAPRKDFHARRKPDFAFWFLYPSPLPGNTFSNVKTPFSDIFLPSKKFLKKLKKFSKRYWHFKRYVLSYKSARGWATENEKQNQMIH